MGVTARGKEGGEVGLLSDALRSELPFASASKRVFVQNYSYENVFPCSFFFRANQTQFHMESFARTRVETEAQGNSGIAYRYC